MNSIIVTGCHGLIGSYSCKHLSSLGFRIVGIDCDIRSVLFDDVDSLDQKTLTSLNTELGIESFYNIDLRDKDELFSIVSQESSKYPIVGFIHCAAQPSHDWAVRDPYGDLSLNLNATLNCLESIRQFSPSTLFVQLSTNKVYGDRPNHLPLIELESRFELDTNYRFYDGIDESMSIDNTTHSLFGCSKAAADLYVQEYSRYFGMKCVVLRGGCLTGGNHRGGKLHGFMNYLIRCALNGTEYTVLGYSGKQVRDNVHAHDIAMLISSMIDSSQKNESIEYPVVANVGGGRSNSVSILELINLLRDDFGLHLINNYSSENRIGDHIWYISSNHKLKKLYDWQPTISIHSL